MIRTKAREKTMNEGVEWIFDAYRKEKSSSPNDYDT